MKLSPTLLVPLAFSLPTNAQSLSVLALEGDPVPGFGVLTRPINVAVNSTGEWLAHVDTDASLDEVILRNGQPFIGDGQTVGAPAGASIFNLDGLAINDDGQALFNHGLSGVPSSTNQGVYLDDDLLILKNDIVTAPQASMGTNFGNFYDVKVAKSGFALIRGFYRDPIIPGTSQDYIMLIEIDATGTLLSQTVIAVEGTIPNGQSLTFNAAQIDPNEAAVNVCGDVIWAADLDTASVPGDGVVYRNDALLAQEGTPTGFGGEWGPLTTLAVDINTAGDWVMRTELQNSDLVITKNGQLLISAGDTLGDIGGFVLENFGFAPLRIDDYGNVAWFGNWDDPNTSHDEGIFINERLVIQEGVTTIGGLVVSDISSNDKAFDLSRNGRFLIFHGELENGLEGVFLLDRDVGDSYCMGAINSTGLPGLIHAQGSTSFVANDLVLSVENIPAFQTGIFFYGNAPTNVPFGNGTLCVTAGMGSQLYRLPTTNASKAEMISWELDNQATPNIGQIVPGSTWRFQCWYRDPQGGGAFFSLSDATTVAITP